MPHQNSEKPLDPVTFRFPLADVTGKFLRDPSLWGSLGFREYYEGTFSETEPLIQAIRAVHRGERVAEDHLRTLRSFSLAWLTSSQKGLSAVIDYAVPLADSVQYITRIGFDRPNGEQADGGNSRYRCIHLVLGNGLGIGRSGFQ